MFLFDSRPSDDGREGGMRSATLEYLLPAAAFNVHGDHAFKVKVSLFIFFSDVYKYPII